MGSPEKKLINKRLRGMGPDRRLFRANSGRAWAGTIIAQTPEKIILKNPRPFYGMPEGTPDLIGFESVIITEEMVGQKIAVFVGEEVKASGNLRPAQKDYKTMVERMGGIFRVIRPD